MVQLLAHQSSGACKNPGSACNPQSGLLGPGATVNGQTPLTQEILNKFCDTLEAQYTGTANAPGDPANIPVCAIQQLQNNGPGGVNTADCSTGSTPGWCYVTGPAALAKGCPYTILFSTGMPPNDSSVLLQCLESSTNVLDGG
jgi:hypothetical protein